MILKHFITATCGQSSSRKCKRIIESDRNPQYANVYRKVTALISCKIFKKHVKICLLETLTYYMESFESGLVFSQFKSSKSPGKKFDASLDHLEKYAGLRYISKNDIWWYQTRAQLSRDQLVERHKNCLLCIGGFSKHKSLLRSVEKKLATMQFCCLLGDSECIFSFSSWYTWLPIT